MTAPDDVRAKFEAWLIREHEYAPEDLIWQEKRNCYADYAIHLAWNSYHAAHADLAGEVLELVEADRKYDAAVHALYRTHGVEEAHAAHRKLADAKALRAAALAKFHPTQPEE